MNEHRCRSGNTRLQDFVDGLLDPDEERRVREHLAVCEGCRREERDLRRLLARVADLPREVRPPRDLWPEVSGRLPERRPATSPAFGPGKSRLHGGPTPVRSRSRRQWLLRAAAALFFMGLGSLLTQLATPAGELATPVGERFGTAVPGSDRTARASGAALDFDEIESEYLRAKDALWLVVYSRHEDLSPVTLEIVRRNLFIVDEAIRDLRAALAEDPGNRQLAASLLAQHRRSLHLLHRLTRPAPSDGSAAG